MILVSVDVKEIHDEDPGINYHRHFRCSNHLRSSGVPNSVTEIQQFQDFEGTSVWDLL